MFLKLDKYWGWWRGLMPLIWLYNLKNRKSLKNNKALYKKWGIKKSVFSTIETSTFKNIEVPPKEYPWLDQPNALEKIDEKFSQKEITEEEKINLEKWVNDGYLILKGIVDNETIEKITNEISALKKEGKVYENYTNTKIKDTIFQSKTAWKLAYLKEIIRYLSLIFEKDVVAFQSLNFEVGSQQKPHSDAFHMTTFPAGYMTAAWCALEDIGEEQGPISIYPGSHKLPVISREMIKNNSSNMFWNDTNLNEKFEHYLQEILNRERFEKLIYQPKKGNILLWHYNLVHAGEKINDKQKTRKSMVVHYFAKEIIAYHEISRRPAIINQEFIL